MREWAETATLVGVANKQDLPLALTNERVGSILGIEIQGLNALDFDGGTHDIFKKWIVDSLGLV